VHRLQEPGVLPPNRGWQRVLALVLPGARAKRLLAGAGQDDDAHIAIAVVGHCLLASFAVGGH
jgi:hypothetical protein